MMGEARRDRISELPEDLLVMILSLVPIRDAVATMFLSKRWLFVWTMVRTLEYKDKKQKKKSVWWFLNKSLERHKSDVIDYLDIKLGPQCPNDADIPKLVDNVCNRNVIELSLNLKWSRADPIRLPTSFYMCKTLKELKLSNKILVDFPSSSSACCCLPSLVILQMFCVVYKDEASLVRFLSSCPVLKVLGVRRKNDDNVRKFSVKLPSLWYLSYTKIDDEESDVVEDDGRCLVIDTPSLKELHIRTSEDSCSVENNMHRLENAGIDLGSSFPGIDKFIRSISSVVSSLQLVFTNEVVKQHCRTMKLPQLKKLIIYPEESDWFKPLMLLLQNAPKLKSLTINYVYAGELENLSWSEPSSVPACLSSQLEIFNWIEYEDCIEADEFLTYIFNNSKCLKTAKISVKPTTLEFLDDEDLIDIERELKDIPRASSTSNLFVEMRKEKKCIM